MSRETRQRTRATPRAVLLNAIQSATDAGGAPDHIAEIWTHAALVARVARALAPTADVDPDDAAAAGLLHDVGELLLLGLHPITHSVLCSAETSHASQLAAEKAAFGVDHALLGAEHLLGLHLPDVIADAVADHHDPFRDSATTTVVVAAADEISSADRGRHHAQDLLGISDVVAAVIRRAAVGDPTVRPVRSNRERSLSQ